jgi:mono/diheme cytochrome c family protein
MMKPSSTAPTAGRAITIALAAGLILLGGCRGDREDRPPRQFFPDLDDAPKWEPQGTSEFFADGRMMRVPPAGTVAFGRQQFVSAEPWAAPFSQQRADLLKEDTVYYSGKGADGKYVLKAPIAFTVDDLRRGQERFNISCAVCHGYEGDGKGMVGTRWSYPLPNFHDAKYTDPKQDQGLDGYLFHTGRNGVVGPDGAQKMPGYAHAMSVDDSWRVVAYIRALQQSRSGSMSDVPEAERARLQQAAPAPKGGA